VTVQDVLGWDEAAQVEWMSDELCPWLHRFAGGAQVEPPEAQATKGWFSGLNTVGKVAVLAAALGETFGLFKPFIESGSGPSVVKLPPDITGALLFATHNGSSSFVIEALNSSNHLLDVLVSTTGEYSGTTFVDHGEPAKLKIEADGAWTMRVLPVSSAATTKGTAKGKGDTIMLYSGPSLEVQMRHAGPSVFRVRMFSVSANDLMLDRIGVFSGPVRIPEGPGVLIIESDGPWSIKPR